MKNILLSLSICAFLIACNSKTTSPKDIAGNYTVSLQLDSAGEKEEGLKTMVGMMSAAKIYYQFKEDGTGKYSVKMGAIGNDADITWKLKGQDSLEVSMKEHAEVYALSKTATGLKLGTGHGLDLVLTKDKE